MGSMEPWQVYLVLSALMGVFSTILLLWVKSMTNRAAAKAEATADRLTALMIALPDKYVQREDWIRFAAGIDAKMDKLHEKMDKVLAHERI